MSNRMRWPAVTAGMLATLLVAGCAAAAGSRTAGGGVASTARAGGTALTLPAGGTVMVANADPRQRTAGGLPANGGLLTCRGELNTGPGVTRITIGNAL